VQIGLVGLLGALIQVIDLVNELLQLNRREVNAEAKRRNRRANLRLNVGDLAVGKLVLLQGHLHFLEVLQEAELRRQQEEEGTALLALTTCSTANAIAMY